MKRLILVTGAARSGVSIMGGVLHLCGAHGGRIVRVPEYDGRGSFENHEIRTSVVKPFLQGLGADPRCQNPLPKMRDVATAAREAAPSWRRRVTAIFADQLGMPEGEGTVFYASPQTAIIWPVWARAFPRAEWVIVRRSDNDVIDACMKSHFMNGHKTRTGWARWLGVHKRAFSDIVDSGQSTQFIWPHRMIGGNVSAVKAMVMALGLNWNRDAFVDFMAPILWKGGVYNIRE